jgi:NAD(P)H-hydrate epimerase
LPISLSPLLDDEALKKARGAIIHSAILIDSLFGTGLTREITGHFAAVINLMNTCGIPVISVDIPSGLNADNGHPLGICVRATLTATYGLAQPGLVIYPGVEFIGALHVIDIGIPTQAIEDANISSELLQKNTVRAMIPARKADSHKGSFGHVLLLAGSQGKTGAALLAGQGALRSGSGLVSICVPGQLNHIFEANLLEVMTVPMGSDCFFSLEDYAAIHNAAAGKRALLVGPGIGQQADTADLIRKVYREIDLPMVVDADGLNVLARDFTTMGKPPAIRILTPHPGEMARLLDCSVAKVQTDRMKAAASFAVDNNVFVVLKGAATIIAGPGGELAVNPTGNAAMAAGGMGDVLSGIITSLLGQGAAPWQAACLGVYVHGLAADRIAMNNKVRFGILASEVANELPLAFQDIASD